MYNIHFIDSFSRFTWIYLLRHKSEALPAFVQFKSQVELQLGYKIKVVQTDWDGEYRPFIELLATYGILHQHPCQMGVSSQR